MYNSSSLYGSTAGVKSLTSGMWGKPKSKPKPVSSSFITRAQNVISPVKQVVKATKPIAKAYSAPSQSTVATPRKRILTQAQRGSVKAFRDQSTAQRTSIQRAKMEAMGHKAR